MTSTRQVVAVVVVVGAAVTGVAAFRQQPTPRSGFDPRTFDTSVRPQDNLYRYVNGRWLDTTPMPDDRVSHTATTELIEKTNDDIRAIVERLTKEPGRKAGSATQQVVDLYASMMNEAAIEARGISPLEPELRAIDTIDSVRTLADRAGRLSATSTAGPFFSTVGVHPRNPADRVVQLSQGGLLLERDVYLKDDAASRRIREAYQAYLERIFTLVGRRAPAADAAAVLGLEIELAQAQWPAGDTNDRGGPSAPMTLDQVTTALPGFDWAAWARPQGIDRVSALIVVQPSFFRAFAALVPARPLSTWRAWLAGRYITAMAPNVCQAVSDARFDFFGRRLTGQQAPIPRWKRAVALVNGILGDSVGRAYVDQHFPRSSRTRVDRIVEQLMRAYRQSIADLDWMTPATKAAAQAKLGNMRARIGYPDVWRDYRGLDMRPDDLFGNLERALRFDNARRMARLAQPDERGEWPMAPQTVNAYYVPVQNEILFPAAILQPPYFDADADDAVNYGAIGAVIGHEIGHAFDDTGRQYDATGAVRNWWKPQDEAAYAERAGLMLTQLNGYLPIDGGRVNGALTLREGLNDVAGLSIAYRAYRRSLDGREAAVIDGLNGDQRFFLGWARVWRSKERPEYQQQLLLFSRYPPSMYRANGAVGHVDGFYSAFGVTAGDALFISPARRVRLY